MPDNVATNTIILPVTGSELRSYHRAKCSRGLRFNANMAISKSAGRTRILYLMSL